MKVVQASPHPQLVAASCVQFLQIAHLARDECKAFAGLLWALVWSAKGRICSNKRLFAACLLNIPHERTITHTHTHTLYTSVLVPRP